MKNTRGFIVKERPDLIDEWHPTENKGNTPNNVRSGSDKIITWCCNECDHIWKSQAKSRAIKNTGCPKCMERYNVGFPELAIYFYIKQIFKDTELNSPIDGIGKYKLVDVYIPSLNLVVEYDGGHTHRDRLEIDQDKSKLIIERGYDLIRIRDNGLSPLNMVGVQEYLYERTSNKTISEMIKYLLGIINDRYDGFKTDINKVKAQINVDLDNIPILAQIKPIIEKDNLLDNCPEIETIWNYNKNYPLRPEHFKQYSNHKAWFICEKKHSTLAQIGSKAQGHGCNVCDGKVATEEYNLGLLFPEIAREWNMKLNKNITPDSYLPFSNQVVSWDCPICKSTYNKMINERTGNGEGCPYCAGKRVNETNCLSNTHSHLALEWDYSMNGDLTPNNVTKGSHEKVWWICERNHSYPAYVYSRIDGRGCPTCYKLYGRHKPQKAKRENSLGVKKPEVAKQWHSTKNGDISPYEVGAYARKEYWWLCDNGHEFHKSPNSRRSAKCSYCKN
ncbi:zinc-ribbon domain-containing protein [Psychrobacillus sp. PGGUH221]|uniref:zinc-ribbon domain-containing protein n=1 Tax=Psychrobacillus sp. PGGUH221 TaxID=3020058 RepID=UPI0035C6C2A3